MLRVFAISVVGLLSSAACVVQGLTFEAASVKVSDSDVRQPSYSGGPGTSDPGHIREHLYMVALLQAAFGVRVDQIAGGPAWLRDFSAMPFYDITATMPADTTKGQVEEMLQSLLMERFHLVFHRETRNAPGYALVVDPGGSKLPAASASDATGSDGFPATPGTRAMGYGSTAHQRRKFQEYTMAQFAADLAFLVGRAQGKPLEPNGPFQARVADRTGLTGKFTFILEYNCPACAPLVVSGQDDGSVANDPGGLPDLFGAIRKQLGLGLVQAADVPTEVIVIESVDKTPTVN